MDTSRLRKRTSSPGGRSPRRLSTGGMPESPRAFARPSMQNKPNSQDRRRRWITQNKPNSHPACCAKQSQLPVEDKAETASPRTRQPIVRNKANFRGRGLHDNLWRAGTLALPRKTKPISRACRPGLRAGCAKQSQFAGGRMNANCRSKKGLRAKCTDYVSAKTKPIYRVQTASPAPDQVEGRLCCTCARVRSLRQHTLGIQKAARREASQGLPTLHERSRTTSCRTCDVSGPVAAAATVIPQSEELVC
jgi:hypothetical protein